jgi:hypothetical protein
MTSREVLMINVMRRPEDLSNKPNPITKTFGTFWQVNNP